MTIEQMRNALSQAYPGPKWETKVKEMNERQVVAIYRCMQEENRLHPKKTKNEPGIKKAQQLTIWGLLKEDKL